MTKDIALQSRIMLQTFEWWGGGGGGGGHGLAPHHKNVY